ncbi:MAG: rhodanese-related sulfurtransferase [Pseudanabaenaceae cyanobacterium]
MQVITFYRFQKLDHLSHLQQALYNLCEGLGIKGTIILAAEGINATIAGTTESIERFLANPYFPNLSYKSSPVAEYPFQKLKVKVRSEIITMGRPEVDVCKCTGVHVPPKEWNRLLQDPEVLVLDTRNEYEVKIGTFKGAINPYLDAFSQFPHFVEQRLNPKEHRKVAMFCTGGIRCEKASALMLAMGFPEVYQLQGGILQYLAEVPLTESLWEGECFVFDDRTSVNHDLQVGNYQVVKGQVITKNLALLP